MTAPAALETVHFGLVELDLLSAHAGVAFPFPLRVPSFGRLAGEREVLLATAGETLLRRGLAGETGPVGVAAEVVTALREHRGTVDLVRTGDDGTTGVLALVYRSSVLLCRQRLDGDPAGRVGVQRFHDTALAAELLRLVPEVAAPVSMPITLPAAAVAATTRLTEEPGEQQLRDLFRDHGGDPAVLDGLVGLLVPLHGRGQLGATRRTGGRTGPELSWLDGPRGRVRVNAADDGWLSVNPLRRAGIRSALEELATIVRGSR